MRRPLLALLALFCVIAPVAVPATAAHAAPGDLRRIHLPFLWPNAGLTDIAATGPSDIWVTGVQGEFCLPRIGSACPFYSDGNPVVRRWNGSKWKEYLLPYPWETGGGAMSTVSATGPDDVWVVTEWPFTTPYIAHFDGSAFKEVTPPASWAEAEVFAGKSGTWLRTYHWISGVHTFHRRVGDTWQPFQAGNISEVRDVQARTATDAWAVGRLGEADADADADRAAVARWDGRSWHAVDHPSDVPSLTGVLPVSADDVWATPGGAETDFVLRWNGSTWSRVHLPMTVRGVKLTMDGSGTVWAGGRELASAGGGSDTRPVLLSYTGGVWRRVPVSMPTGATSMSISALTSVPGTGKLWLTANASNGPLVLTQD